MRSLSIIALTLVTTLSGCSGFRDSGANPFNWFGGRQDPVIVREDDAVQNDLIPQRSGLFAQRQERPTADDLATPIDQIVGLAVEPVQGGVIVRATGLDRYSTSYNALLRPSNAEEVPQEGVLVYSFNRLVPEGARVGGTEATRQITVGRFVSTQTLRNVRSIRVDAAQNARSVRP